MKRKLRRIHRTLISSDVAMGGGGRAPIEWPQERGESEGRDKGKGKGT